MMVLNTSDIYEPVASEGRIEIVESEPRIIPVELADE